MDIPFISSLFTDRTVKHALRYTFKTTSINVTSILYNTSKYNVHISNDKAAEEIPY